MLTLSFTPYQLFLILKILFKIRNQHKILRKKLIKNFIFVKTSKNNFSDPKTTNANNPLETFFIVGTPKKPH
jgi:hypothetical protein